jgi:nuclear GTP-binding protein
MPKIRKKSSKRVGFRERYCVLKKVKEHHRKIKKHAKKLGEAGIKPRGTKKGNQIPNSFPNKEMLINEMEAEYQTIQDEKEARQKEIQDQTINFNQQIVNAKVDKQEENDYATTGGLTD